MAIPQVHQSFPVESVTSAIELQKSRENPYPSDPEELAIQANARFEVSCIGISALLLAGMIIASMGAFIAPFMVVMGAFYLVGADILSVIEMIAYSIFANKKKSFDKKAIAEYRDLSKPPSDQAIKYLRRSREAVRILAGDEGIDFHRRSLSGETLLGLHVLPECAQIWVRAGANMDVAWDREGGESFYELAARSNSSLEGIGLLPASKKPCSLLQAERAPADPAPFPMQRAAWETSAPLPTPPPSRWPELLSAIETRS
jgi:hypothetical protein